MANQMNSGSIDTLNQNDTLLTRVLSTSSLDKVQLEFVESIQNPHSAGNNSGINLLYLANKSDSRFSRRVQYAWLTGTPEDVFPLFNISMPDASAWQDEMKDGEKTGKKYIDFNILNPELEGQATADGEPVRARVQVVESLIPNKWQEEDMENRCKTRGKGGSAILHNGKRIFVQRTIMASAGNTPAASEFLKPDPEGASLDTSALSPFQDTVGIELP